MVGRISESATAVAPSEIRPKVFLGCILWEPCLYCLSPAPQAEPQAVGFSAGLSPAPQAEPQAAGFSAVLSPAPQAEPQAAGFSVGLSPAPQAEPQAAGFSAGLSPAPQAVAGADASAFLFQPKRLEIAMIVTSINSCQTAFPVRIFIVGHLCPEKKYAQIYY